MYLPYSAEHVSPNVPHVSVLINLCVKKKKDRLLVQFMSSSCVGGNQPSLLLAPATGSSAYCRCGDNMNMTSCH